MSESAEGSRERASWLAVLALADREALERAWRRVDPRPELTYLRRPETGLVMVRGRMGGTGRRFNLGEMTVTRCAVRLGRDTVGHGWVQGRDRRKATLVAVFDALLQTDQRAKVEADVVQPLARADEARSLAMRRKAAATRVDFFTLVRGDA
jgi:alpha-D-ribose 1-methylphosphonate 5-triphosphate synthase subunit PhnG